MEMSNIGIREGEPVVNGTAPADTTTRFVFVDLDGTLIQTDLIHEAVAILLKQLSFGFLLRLLLQLAHGRAVFKRFLSEAVMLEIPELPFRPEVLDFIAEQKSLGRKVILATASDGAWARRVAEHLNVFEAVLA